MPPSDYFDVEIHLFSRDRVRLVCPDRQEYVDDVRLGQLGRLEQLSRPLELEHAMQPSAYGRELFAATFPAGSELQRGLYSVLDRSRREKRRLRLRLNIDAGAPALHALNWELLEDGKDFEVGRSPETVFSRYVSQPYAIGPAPAKPRMLCVISAPIDAHRHQLAPIDYDVTRRRLEECLKDLRPALEIEFLDRPVTPGKLRDWLRNGGFHLLHLHGHGTIPRQGESVLVLEDDDHKVRFTTESALGGILLGLRDLKLVTLVACHGGALSSKDDHLSGLAGSLVRRNVAAVIAMRRAISMKMGTDFTRFLYHQLAQEPCIDAAVNEARHRLYLENPGGAEWSSPVLYMRLADGMLWLKDNCVPRAEVPLSPIWRRWRLYLLAAPIVLAAVLLSAYQPPLFPEAPVAAAITGLASFLIMSSRKAATARVPSAAPKPRFLGVGLLIGAVVLTAAYVLLLQFTTVGPPVGWETSTRIQIGFHMATWSLTPEALSYLETNPDTRTPQQLLLAHAGYSAPELVWRPWAINAASSLLIALLLAIFLSLGWGCSELARVWDGAGGDAGRPSS